MTENLKKRIKSTKKPTSTTKADVNIETNSVEMDIDIMDWQTAYSDWHKRHFTKKHSSDIVPNEQQAIVLSLIHERSVDEYKQKHHDERHLVQMKPPLRHLVHGLPGSGKSELLRWIRSYFESVWRWKYGDEFVFLAPLNSMASNIGGNTVHSWGAVVFQDRRGRNIKPKSCENEEVQSMTIRCGKLRFLFIDEIEATGAETIESLERNILFHVSNSNEYKHSWTADGKGNLTKDIIPRRFAGINTFFLGDFWQLNPTGQTSLMSNPYSNRVLSSARANSIMQMFWQVHDNDGLLPWPDGKKSYI